jgi:hypothetical protein
VPKRCSLSAWKWEASHYQPIVISYLEFSRLTNKSTSPRSSSICSRLTATSFVKFLLLSRANEGASVSCLLDHSATSFASNGFLRTLQVTLKSILLYFIWLWIFLSVILLVSHKLFWTNYFSLNLHFTRECEINPVSEYFNFYSHKVFEFYEIPVKVLFSGFCLDSSLLL